jgi:hypothetical protein
MYCTTRETSYGPFKVYCDVDPRFLDMKEGDRVLPAPFFENEATLFFTLKKKYDKGDNLTFPHGGYEVYGPSGEIRNYDLDQLILHPFQLGMKNYFVKKDSVSTKDETIDTGEKRKRGRPSSPFKKEKEQYVPTGGKRGRPKSDKPKKEKAVKTGGKRGRPALSEQERMKRDEEKKIKTNKSGGKRGRPSKKNK